MTNFPDKVKVFCDCSRQIVDFKTFDNISQVDSSYLVGYFERAVGPVTNAFIAKAKDKRVAYVTFVMPADAAQ